jgi:hypothetical protein
MAQCQYIFFSENRTDTNFSPDTNFSLVRMAVSLLGKLVPLLTMLVSRHNVLLGLLVLPEIGPAYPERSVSLAMMESATTLTFSPTPGIASTLSTSSLNLPWVDLTAC